MTWRKKHGDFSRYGNGEVEAAGYTTCDGCPGGNVEYAVGEMKGSGAEVIHPAAGLVVGYPPCPHIACFGDFVGTRYGLEVVYGTHPVPQKYLRMYDGLGTWGDPAWKEIIQPALADEQTRLACDQRTSGTGENGKQVMMREKDASEKWSRGCRLPFDEWAWINRNGIFEEPRLREYVAPFPPMPLMCNVSGLTVEQDFAHHGVDIYAALSEASPKPLTEYENVLDFGCGCGRLARMFKGHPGRITGCDVDPGHVSWINENLDYMKAVRTDVHPPPSF